jgi:hypothetical protein
MLMLTRALFGEDLRALRAEIGSHVARTVAFFLCSVPAQRRRLKLMDVWSSIEDNYFLLHSPAHVLSMLEPIVWS